MLRNVEKLSFGTAFLNIMKKSKGVWEKSTDPVSRAAGPFL